MRRCHMESIGLDGEGPHPDGSSGRGDGFGSEEGDYREVHATLLLPTYATPPTSFLAQPMRFSSVKQWRRRQTDDTTMTPLNVPLIPSNLPQDAGAGSAKPCSARHVYFSVVLPIFLCFLF